MKKLFIFVALIGAAIVYSQVSSIPTASGSNPDTGVYLTRATDQAGTDIYCRSTTGNDTYTCGLTPALTAYTAGSCLVLNPNAANTGAATVNVDSLGAKSILSRSGGALSDGDITADKPITVCYDGTQYIIQGDGGSGASSAQWHHFRGAVCQNTVAGAGFSTPSSNAPTADCDSGTNTLFGVLQFTEASTQSAQTWFQLPDSFTSAEVELYWRTSATSGDVAWQFQTACLATSEALGNGGSGGPSWNTTQEITSTADGTARDIVRIALTSLTTTGCAANELLLLRISRDPTDAQDTIAATAELVSLSIKITP